MSVAMNRRIGALNIVCQTLIVEGAAQEKGVAQMSLGQVIRQLHLLPQNDLRALSCCCKSLRATAGESYRHTWVILLKRMRVTYRTQAGLPIRISHPTIDQAKELLSRIGLQDPRTRLLMWHAGYDHVTELRQLMDQGVFVDVRGTGGGTALRVAAAAGAMRSLEFLIEAGARVDGSLALAAAASRGRLLAVRLLLAHGGNADERHHESVLTALMCASSEGNVEIVRELLLAGASVDLRDEFERTALMLAATNGHTEVVDLLLAEGANVNARDMAGRRAVDLVPPYHQAVMQLLVRSGARRGPAPLRILSCLPCSVFGGR